MFTLCTGLLEGMWIAYMSTFKIIIFSFSGKKERIILPSKITAHTHTQTHLAQARTHRHQYHTGTDTNGNTLNNLDDV